VGELKRLIGAEPVPSGVDAEQFAHRVAEFVIGPLWVVSGGFVAIANSNSLDIGFLQEVEHDTEALRAYADESQVDSVTRGNVAGAAEDAARDNG
jgi:hypothetical protein